MDVIDINNYAKSKKKDQIAAAECLDTDPAIDYRYAKASQDWESDGEFVRLFASPRLFV
jgi:hypothetical protein